MQVACTLASTSNSDRMSLFQIAGLLAFVVPLFMTYLFAILVKDFALAEVFGSIGGQNHAGPS
jgi:hypothetical protein